MAKVKAIKLTTNKTKVAKVAEVAAPVERKPVVATVHTKKAVKRSAEASAVEHTKKPKKQVAKVVSKNEACSESSSSDDDDEQLVTSDEEDAEPAAADSESEDEDDIANDGKFVKYVES